MADSGNKSVYLRIPYTEGSVTATGFKDWIAISAFKFTIKTPVTLGDWIELMEGVDIFEEGGLEIERPEYSEFTVEKQLDDASGDLLQQTLTAAGLHDESTFELVICAPDAGSEDGKPNEFVRFTLLEATVVGYEMEGSDVAKEKLTISYNELRIKFTPHDPDEKTKSPVYVSADLHD